VRKASSGRPPRESVRCGATQAEVLVLRHGGRIARWNRAQDRVLLLVLQRSHDVRCSSGSGRGQAPPPALEQDGARRRAAKAGRPLSRETSAGTRAEAPRRAARSVRRTSSGVTRSQWPTWRKGPQPLLEVSSQSGASRRGPVGCSIRGSNGLVVVLAGCAGCRNRRTAPGPNVPFAVSRKLAKNPLGSGHSAKCSGGERTPEAGPSVETPWSRWHAARDPVVSGQARRKLSLTGTRGESFGRRKSGRRRWYSSREGVLVPAKLPFLTRWRWRWCLAACPGLGDKLGPHGWLRQRTSEATLRAWCGRQRRDREILRGGAAIEAPPGPRGILARAGIRVSALFARFGESLLG